MSENSYHPNTPNTPYAPPTVSNNISFHPANDTLTMARPQYVSGPAATHAPTTTNNTHLAPPCPQQAHTGPSGGDMAASTGPHPHAQTHLFTSGPFAGSYLTQAQVIPLQPTRIQAMPLQSIAQLHDHSLAEAMATVSGTVLIKVPNDDVDQVKADGTAKDDHVMSMFNALIHDYDPSPNLTAEKMDRYRAKMNTYSDFIAAMLQSPEGRQTAQARCRIAIEKLIEFHEDGIHQDVFNKNKANKRVSKKLDLEMKCSKRLADLIFVVKMNKKVAEDVLTGKYLEPLIWSPMDYHRAKVVYLGSNAHRDKQAKEAKAAADASADDPAEPASPEESGSKKRDGQEKDAGVNGTSKKRKNQSSEEDGKVTDEPIAKKTRKTKPGKKAQQDVDNAAPAPLAPMVPQNGGFGNGNGILNHSAYQKPSQLHSQQHNGTFDNSFQRHQQPKMMGTSQYGSGYGMQGPGISTGPSNYSRPQHPDLPTSMSTGTPDIATQPTHNGFDATNAMFNQTESPGLQEGEARANGDSGYVTRQSPAGSTGTDSGSEQTAAGAAVARIDTQRGDRVSGGAKTIFEGTSSPNLLDDSNLSAEQINEMLLNQVLIEAGFQPLVPGSEDINEQHPQTNTPDSEPSFADAPSGDGVGINPSMISNHHSVAGASQQNAGAGVDAEYVDDGFASPNDPLGELDYYGYEFMRQNAHPN